MSFSYLEIFSLVYVICVVLVLLFRRFALRPHERKFATLLAGFTPVLNVLFVIFIGVLLLSCWYDERQPRQSDLYTEGQHG